jgi:hypothetical protein
MFAFTFAELNNLQLAILDRQNRFRQRVRDDELGRPVRPKLRLQHRHHPRTVLTNVAHHVCRADNVRVGKAVDDGVQSHEVIAMRVGNHDRRQCLSRFS